MRSSKTMALAIVVGLVALPAAQADEIAKKIQSTMSKIQGSVVQVKYTRDVGDLGGQIEGEVRRRGGGGGGRGFMRAIGGPTSASGLIANDKGFIAVSADISRNPFRGWGGRNQSSTLEFKELKVVLSDGEERPAKVVGRDSSLNMLFLQVDNAEGLAPVEFSSKSEIGLGEQVLVIAPMEEENSTPKFLLTRINAITSGDTPAYSLMDDISDYNGGLVCTLDGDVVGIIGRPSGGDDDEADLRMVRRFVGGRRGDLRVIPSAAISPIFADPPTGLEAEGEEEAAGPLTGPRDPKKPDEKEGEGEKKPEKKGEEKSGDDY